MSSQKAQTIYIDSRKKDAFYKFVEALSIFFNSYTISNYSDIIILCIGTDRSTGDSLGPLIGYKLQDLFYDHVHVLGTLEQPVHAKNLQDKINFIYSRYKKPLIIAIDACLGKMDHIGYIGVSNKPMRPGAGVNKELPEVGNISITGIVNFHGYMDFFVLQNTRLHLVMNMADIISSGLKYILWRELKLNIEDQRVL